MRRFGHRLIPIHYPLLGEMSNRDIINKQLRALCPLMFGGYLTALLFAFAGYYLAKQPVLNSDWRLIGCIVGIGIGLYFAGVAVYRTSKITCPECNQALTKELLFSNRKYWELPKKFKACRHCQATFDNNA